VEATRVLITAVRERCCPGCDAPVRERSARWCGRCGEALEAVPADDPSAGRGTVPWGRVALVAGGALATVALVASAGPIVDRLPAPTDPLAEAEVASPDDEALGRIGRRYLPPPAPVTEPVCLRDPGHACLRWHVADRSSTPGAVAIAGDVVVVAQPSDPQLRALDLRDGTVAWTATVDSAAPQLAATDELVLTLDRDGLTVRDAADGTIRFGLDGFGHDAWLSAKQAGDRLVLVADHGGVALGPDGEDGQAEPFTALGVDAVTGEVTWRSNGIGAAGVAADGTSVLVEGEALVARTPDGEVSWTRTPEQPPGGGWIAGRLVHVWARDGSADRLYRLEDGDPLDVRGHVVAWSGRHALLETGPADGPGTDARLVLLEDHEPVWEITAPSECSNGARIAIALVHVVTCDGTEVTYDLADGRELGTVPPEPAGGADGSWAGSERIGPYTLGPESAQDARSAWVLVDTRTDVEVVRLPPNAYAVQRDTPDGWRVDADGVAVIQHLGGLTAIDVPPTDTRPAAMLRTFVR
jgi:outer membrane protein assembly factor BamB